MLCQFSEPSARTFTAEKLPDVVTQHTVTVQSQVGDRVYPQNVFLEAREIT